MSGNRIIPNEPSMMRFLILCVLLTSCILVGDKNFNQKTGDVFIANYGVFGKRKIVLKGKKTYISDDLLYFKNVVPGKYELEVQFVNNDDSSSHKPTIWRKSVIKDIDVSAGFVTLGSVLLHCEYNRTTKWFGKKVPRRLMDTNGKIEGRIEPFDESFREIYPNLKIFLTGKIGSKVFKQVTQPDSSGRFNFENVKPGIYGLVAETAYYGFRSPYISDIIVLPARIANVKIASDINLISDISEVYNPCGF